MEKTLILLLTFCFLGCHIFQSPANSSEPPSNNARLSGSELDKDVKELQKEDNKQSEDLAQFKMMIQNLQEITDNLRKEVDILKRGTRSGLYEYQGNSEEIKDDTGSLLPSYIPGPANLEDRKTRVTEGTNHSHEYKLSPEKLLTRAQIEINRQLFKDSIKTLNQFHRMYPNSQNDDLYFVLKARSFKGLKLYQKALDSLRPLFLQYPHSKEIPNAKLIEGMIYMEIGTTHRAVDVFEYLIKKYPDQPAAIEAREKLSKLENSSR